MTRVVLLVAALASCAPSLRVVADRCPSAKPIDEDFWGVAPQFVDFVIASALLATGAYELNNGRPAIALAAAAGGMGTALLSNLAECR